jgi:hypothetical protein
LNPGNTQLHTLDIIRKNHEFVNEYMWSVVKVSVIQVETFVSVARKRERKKTKNRKRERKKKGQNVSVKSKQAPQTVQVVVQRARTAR